MIANIVKADMSQPIALNILPIIQPNNKPISAPMNITIILTTFATAMLMRYG